MKSFQEMGLDPIINTSLATLNFTEPTPIQAQTIPLALAGKDILGSAQTGTGKTLAFTIPLVNRLLNNQSEMALVLVPTRELAQQVATAIKQVTNKQRGLRTALLIGGDSFFKQLQQLRAQARIIVGTPGRVIDHLKRATVSPEKITFLVLDETDRMFDMGFERQIEQIIAQIPQQRQTLMFSATLPASIVKTASRYLIQPERIAVGEVSSPVARIKQEVAFVSESEKEAKLIEELAKCTESIVIFVKTKWNADKLADKLCALDLRAIALHGDLRQNKRERVVNSFRKGTHNILVATDIAARGLDIPQIRHIINYDLPQCPEDYIHRIGRTGRAGAEGFSLCLVTPKENKNWKIINRFANTNEGISDSDRAELSHKPRRDGGRRGGSFGGGRGGRDGFSSDRGPRDGGRGGRREFGSRDRFNDRPRKERSFRKDFDVTESGVQASSVEGDFGARKPRFDRPFERRERSSRFGGSDERRPFFKKDRPSFGAPRSEDGGEFKRAPRFDRPFGDSSERRPRRNREDSSFIPARTEGGDRARKPFFDRSSERRGTGGNGFFKKERSFSRPFSDAPSGEFRPKRRERFGSQSEQFFEGGDRPSFKRKKQD